MPNRILKESICTSEELANISDAAQVLFFRLIVKADDFGLYHGNPKIIASLCFPLAVPPASKVTSWLNELRKVGLISTYQAEGKTYLKLMSWDKHQTRRSQKSKFPLPENLDEYDVSCEQLHADESNCNHLHAIVSVNDNENDNENDNDNENENVVKKVSLTDLFERFWNVYPRKVNKKEAIKAWNSLKPSEGLTEEIIAGVTYWKKSKQWSKDNGQFIPHASTFLRGERWKERDTVTDTFNADGEGNDYEAFLASYNPKLRSVAG